MGAAKKENDRIEFDRIIGKHIKKERIRMGMSRMDVSRAIGRTPSIIDAIESGRISSNIFRIVEICLIIEVNPGDILDRAVYELHTKKEKV